MGVKESFEDLQCSEEFKSFLENESGFILAHAHLMKEFDKDADWEFGFYNASRDAMTVFETNPVVRTPEQEVFKKSGVLKELDLNLVEVDFDEAMRLCETVRKDKYSSELIAKYIVILQNLHKQLWNITLVTKSFGLINIRIDAKSGDIISSNMTSIGDLGIKSV
ncbi:hypothetical protein K9L97_00605 [Candidatus Woesearchaeota archaeon]|nr:hypothetical protein [Candidatus Woesearchaeota archaeon]